MPASPFIDLDSIDLTRMHTTREQLYEHLPHRFEFMMLNGIVHLDVEGNVAVGVREITEDEFWVKGHIPGRPLFPGVLMLESAAQLASYFSHIMRPAEGFLGFGGLENVKFRASITPPATMYIVEKAIEIRPRRTVCDAQGFVDGKMVFEARITGMRV